MLPHELADELCSLRPHQDRLCVTVEIPPSGEPQFYRSVIRSDARLTYGKAEQRDAPGEIQAALDLNDELARELRAKRFARGALQVQTPEIAFRFDRDGGVADAWLEGESHAHMLVEELMVLANELVGAFLSGRRREALYRVHERPDPQAVEHLLAKLVALGVPTPPVPDRMTPQQAAGLTGAISEQITAYVEQSGAVRPEEPRPLRPRKPGVRALHLADPALPRPDRAQSVAARARSRRRPAARRPGGARRAHVGPRA
jgi:ribonuclease R